MVNVTVRGANELDRLGKRLKAAGDKDLKKELLRGIRETNKPTIAKIRASARADLPHRGGLAAIVGRSPIGTRTRLSGAKVGVRIRGTSKAANLYRIDAGTVRHPVFGNRKVFVNQAVKGGWFSKTVEADAPAIGKNIRKVMGDVAHKIEKG